MNDNLFTKWYRKGGASDTDSYIKSNLEEKERYACSPYIGKTWDWMWWYRQLTGEDNG